MIDSTSPRRTSSPAASKESAAGPATITFDEVVAAELRSIRKRREFVVASLKRARAAESAGPPSNGVTAPAAAPIPSADEAIQERRAAIETSQAAIRAAARAVQEVSPRLDESLDTTRHSKPDADARQTAVRVEALDRHLVGLSFSGGGIRSGTFSVGILQGLSKLGLLRRFDYLSTVSGGGYAGAWLAAWIKRDGDPANVEQQLDPSRVVQSLANRGSVDPTVGLLPHREVTDEEPEPLHHLRRYSSYMTPNSGAFTADTWTILGIWLRNGLINQMMLLPLTMLLVLAVRALVQVYRLAVPRGDPRFVVGTNLPFQLGLMWSLAGSGLVLFLLAFFCNAWGVADFRQRSVARQFWTEASRQRILKAWNLAETKLTWLVLWPLLLAASCMTIAYRVVLPDLHTRVIGEVAAVNDPVGVSFPSFISATNLAGHALVFGVLILAVSVLASIFHRRWNRAFLIAAFMAGATGGFCFALVEMLLASDLFDPRLLATFATPIGLLVIVLAIVVEVALLGRAIEESEREWWARLVGLLLVTSIGWMATVGLILYLPGWLIQAGSGLQALVTAGWVGTTIGGLLASRSRIAPKARPSLPTAAIVAVAPPVFLAGLLATVSLLTSSLLLVIVPPPPQRSIGNILSLASYQDGLSGDLIGGWPIGGLAVVCLGLAVVGFRLIDVNLFSLNAMYANRLARAYLGASRCKARWQERWGGQHEPSEGGGAPIRSVGPATRDGNGVPHPDHRNENPVTGFDLGDDLALMDLKIGAGAPDTAYWGPQLIINTALNLVAGKELAWRSRKAESFVLTPEFCGSKGTGYARLAVPPGLTDEAANTRRRELGQLTLGRAISISGAAIDPNMSFFQSPALTAFLTVFNARLGYWIENPDRRKWSGSGLWSAASPTSGELLWNELRGRTDGKGRFVHLSDGGHFENLGVYELIRRRVRYIVCVDAGGDPAASDDNLANLIRLARTDLGVRVQIDTKPLAVGANGLAGSHVAVGRVRYDDLDNSQLPGVIVYIRLSMTGDEPSDVQNYAATHADFPYEATDFRQSFDEAHFESYRALGEHIARAVFEDGLTALDVADLPLWKRANLDEVFPQGNQELFAAVVNRWADQSPTLSNHESRTAHAWTELQRELRKDPALAALSREIYPEAATEPAALSTEADPSNRPRAELHAVAEMLQIMEDAWASLGVRGQQVRPLDRGWMNVFARWSATKAFHRYWPVLSPEFNREFVLFCRSQLHLVPPEARAERITTLDAVAAALSPLPAAPDRVGPETAAVRAMAAEFAREWPTEAAANRGILDLLARSEDLRQSLARAARPGGPVDTFDRPLAWLGWLSPLGTDQPADRFAVGLFLVWRDPVNPAVIRFFAWIRPVHRSLGVGARFVEHVLKELAPLLPGHTLRIRYPAWPRGAITNGMGANWRAFFARFDFRNPPAGPTDLDGDNDLFLERTLDGPP